MGRVREPEPVQPIVALLARDEAALGLAREAAARIVGPLSLLSPVWPFEWTRYYEAEMGASLLRQIVAAEAPADPGALVAWKRAAQAEEARIAAGAGEEPALGTSSGGSAPASGVPGEGIPPTRGRPANLDPGYIAGPKLVLASTKDFSHRIYLSQGIYAEVTLQYARGRFEPLPWTYPDWRSGRYDEFLHAARAHWRERIAAAAGHPGPVQSMQP